MNKNDKFHGAEFEVSAQTISNEALENISGGSSEEGEPYTYLCPVCGMSSSSIFSHIAMDYLKIHIESKHPGYYNPNNQYS